MRREVKTVKATMHTIIVHFYCIAQPYRTWYLGTIETEIGPSMDEELLTSVRSLLAMEALYRAERSFPSTGYLTTLLTRTFSYLLVDEEFTTIHLIVGSIPPRCKAYGHSMLASSGIEGSGFTAHHWFLMPCSHFGGEQSRIVYLLNLYLRKASKEERDIMLESKSVVLRFEMTYLRPDESLHLDVVGNEERGLKRCEGRLPVEFNTLGRVTLVFVQEEAWKRGKVEIEDLVIEA